MKKINLDKKTSTSSSNDKQAFHLKGEIKNQLCEVIVKQTVGESNFEMIDYKDVFFVKTPTETKQLKLPDFIWNLYYENQENLTTTERLTEYIFGGGIISNVPTFNADTKLNSLGETLSDIVRKAIKSFIMTDGFATEISINEKNQIAEMYNKQVKDIRTNKKEDIIFYSEDWNEKKSEVVIVPRINSWNTIAELTDKQVIYFSKGHRTIGVYPVPSYIAAVNAMLTSIEMQRCNLNDTMNGFSAGVILNVPNAGHWSSEEKEEFEENIDITFSGSNGRKILTVYNTGDIDNVKVESIPTIDVEKYEALKKTVTLSILSSKGILSSELVGIARESNGFSAVEYNEAFDIFNKTTIRSLRKEFLDEFNKMLKVFIPEIKIELVPFSLDEKKAVTEDEANVQQSALNGAQISSMLEIINNISLKVLSKPSAKAIMAAAFPTFSVEMIDNIIDNL